jgi:hypothetical protein
MIYAWGRRPPYKESTPSRCRTSNCRRGSRGCPRAGNWSPGRLAPGGPAGRAVIPRGGRPPYPFVCTGGRVVCTGGRDRENRGQVGPVRTARFHPGTSAVPPRSPHGARFHPATSRYPLCPRDGPDRVNRVVGPGRVDEERRTSLVTPLAGADRPEAAALRLVECHVTADRDGCGDDDDPDRGPPRENGQQDQPENDPGDPNLGARCHDDSIHPDPPGPS